MSKPKKIYLEGNLQERKKVLNSILSFYSNHSVFDIKSIDIDELVKLFNSSDCFEENKLFIINEISFKSNKNSVVNLIKKNIENIAENNVIIFNNINFENLKKVISSLKDGKVIEYKDILTASEATNYILQFFKEKEKTISSEVLQLLIKYNFEKDIEINRLNLILQKCLTFVGKQKEVLESDILLLFGENYFNTIFQLFQHLDKKDLEEAVKVWNYILYNSTTDIKSFIISTLYLFSWRYKGLFLVKEELFHSQSVDFLNKFCKVSSKGLKEEMICNLEEKPVWGNFQLNTMQEIVKNFKRKELRIILDVVDWAIIKTRKGLNEEYFKFIIDVVILTCCGKLTDIQVEKILK